MPKIPVSEGITSRFIEANGIRLHILERGNANAPHKILMIHGNVAAATWWEEVMLALDESNFHSVAVDLRGYGESDPAPLDAARGLCDFTDDLASVVQVLGWGKHHIIGHSLGGSIGYRYLIEHGSDVLSATLIAPGSPYGFGGTKDVDGTPCYPNFAGSGGGIRNPELIRMMQENYRGTDHIAAPRNGLRTLVFKPPFIHPREEAILDAMNATVVGDDNYTGNFVPSANWPGFAPGDRGVNNALSPKYHIGYKIVDIQGHKPPILWIRGADDLVVSNHALSDLATHGISGLIPGWPGEDVFPQQPMIDQTRAVLERYNVAGGDYAEHVFDDCGHSPQAEKLDEFMALFEPFVQQHS